MAKQIGCTTMKTPFTYLGFPVGANMRRLEAWHEAVQNAISKLYN